MYKVFTDRSRIERYQRCPRARFLEYHQGGKGIVPVKTPLPLAVGESVHAGLAFLLDWSLKNPQHTEALIRAVDPGYILSQWGVEDEAVRVALVDFQQYTQVGLELDAFERAQMGAGQPQATAQDGSTYEQQLVAQARALGMNDAEVAQYEEALRRNRGTEDFEKYLEVEQSALVEALVRTYARRRLRPLLEQFEVLEVEREGEWKLSEWQPRTYEQYSPWCETCEHGLGNHEIGQGRCLFDNCKCTQFLPKPLLDDYELWFMSRPDALLRERSSNQLYLLSFKTTSAWDRRKEADATHDMQGLSEGVEVERRLAEWWQLVHASPEVMLPDTTITMVNYLASLSAPPRILAVRYEFLLKGERWKDKDLALRFGMDNVRSQKTPLLRQYVAHSLPKRGESAFNLGDTCWSYDYVKEDGAAGSLYYGHWKSQAVFEGGGATATQYGETRPVAGASSVSVKQWINALDASTEAMSGYDATVGLPPRPLGWKGPAQALGYTAQHPLDTVFVPPIIVTRNDDDLRNLFESVEAQERGVAEAVAQLRAMGDEGERRSLMNQHFPMYRKSCEWPSECVFVRVCYAADQGMREAPQASGLFKARVPNHPQEAEK